MKASSREAPGSERGPGDLLPQLGGSPGRLGRPLARARASGARLLQEARALAALRPAWPNSRARAGGPSARPTIASPRPIGAPSAARHLPALSEHPADRPGRRHPPPPSCPHRLRAPGPGTGQLPSHDERRRSPAALALVALAHDRQACVERGLLARALRGNRVERLRACRLRAEADLCRAHGCPAGPVETVRERHFRARVAHDADAAARFRGIRPEVSRRA